MAPAGLRRLTIACAEEFRESYTRGDFVALAKKRRPKFREETARGPIGRIKTVTTKMKGEVAAAREEALARHVEDWNSDYYYDKSAKKWCRTSPGLRVDLEEVRRYLNSKRPTYERAVWAGVRTRKRSPGPKRAGA